MFRNVFMKTLWEQRRSLVWWSLGIAALLIVNYPLLSQLRRGG